MECFNCNCQMREQTLRFENEFKGSMIEFVAPAFRCPECDSVFSTLEQKRQGMIALADAYKKKECLLTSGQIREYRDKLGMSQEQFANFLGVGVASVKRWESTTVQDPSNNELIKLKCDPTYADANLISSLMTMERSEQNGDRKFSPELFAQVLLRLLPHAKSPLFFFKAMFYVDFLHFKHHGTSITGCPYRALPYGPVPKYYEAILDYIKTKEWFVPGLGYDLEIGKLALDNSIFSDDELASIDKVVAMLKAEGAQHVFERSHEENAYKETPPFAVISYEHASRLSF